MANTMTFMAWDFLEFLVNSISDRKQSGMDYFSEVEENCTLLFFILFKHFKLLNGPFFLLTFCFTGLFAGLS